MKESKLFSHGVKEISVFLSNSQLLQKTHTAKKEPHLKNKFFIFCLNIGITEKTPQGKRRSPKRTKSAQGPVNSLVNIEL